MMAASGGAIVNLSSIASRVGMPRAAYNAAKAGIDSLTRTLAVEEVHRRVRVYAVAPRYVHTAMWGKLSADGDVDGAPIIALPHLGASRSRRRSVGSWPSSCRPTRPTSPASASSSTGA